MRLSHRAGNLIWTTVAVVFVGAMLIATLGRPAARTPDEHMLSVAASIKCPTCIGQSVAQSEAPASQDIRADIGRRITLGESDDQIRQDLASRFGPDILLSPSHRGIVGLVWLLPVAVALAVLIGLVLAFRRWRLPAAGDVSEADRLLVTDALAEFADSLDVSEDHISLL